MARSLAQQRLRLGYHARSELLEHLVGVDLLLGFGDLGGLALRVDGLWRGGLVGLFDRALRHLVPRLLLFSLFPSVRSRFTVLYSYESSVG